MTANTSALSSKLHYDYRFGGTVPAASGYSASSNRWSSFKESFFRPATHFVGVWQNLSANWISPPEVGEKNNLLAQLVEYQALPDDWDGYGGKAAGIETVLDALHFLVRYPSTLPLPKPMVGGSGVIGLYWEGNGCYASIDFDGSGSYCYIADSPEEENGEDAVPVDSPLPQPLAEVIAATSNSF